MKKIRIVIISIVLLCLFFLIALNINAVDYNPEDYSEYNIVFSYPGYFEENIIVKTYSGDAPYWSEINIDSYVVDDVVTFMIGDNNYLYVTINNKNNDFYGKTFVVKSDGNYLNIGSYMGNHTYYLELISNSHSLVVDGHDVDYYLEIPSACSTWQHFVYANTPHNDIFRINDGYVFLNGYALKCGDDFVKATDIININANYTESLNLHVHNWTSTRDVIRPGNCLQTPIIVQECSICNEQREYEDVDWNMKSHHVLKTLNYTPATCITAGYSMTQCEVCEEIIEENINPLGHNFRASNCTEPGVCTRLGCNAEVSAVGHDLNWLGRCKRDGCDYRRIGETISDAWSGAVNKGKDFFSSVGQGVGRLWNGASDKVGDTVSNVIEYITPGEDGKGIFANLDAATSNESPVKKGIKIVFTLILVALLIIIICKVMPHIINFFDYLKNRKSNNRRRR